MNLTISVDDDVLQRARELAHKQGKSVQRLIRDYLESLTGGARPEELVEDLFRIMDESPGHSGGKHPRREDAYEDRT